MRVLVTGASGPAGRSLLSQLRDRGMRPLGCDLAPVPREDGIPVLPVPPAIDPSYVSALRDLMSAESIDVLLPTVSEELPIVARARLRGAVVGTAEAVSRAADKWFTAVVLRDQGVAVPLTLLPHELHEGSVRRLGLPVLTKPRVSRGGRGVRLHETHPVAAGRDEIVCEFAPGDEFCVEVHVSVHTDAVTTVVLRKTTLRSGRHGNADAVVAEDVPDVAALAVRACLALGLTGPADVDVRRRADGTPVVLEVNARFGAHSAAAPAILDAVLRDARRTTGLTRLVTPGAAAADTEARMVAAWSA